MEENDLKKNADKGIDSCLICGTRRFEVHEEDLPQSEFETLSMLVQPNGKARFMYCHKCEEYSVMTVW